MTDSKIPLSDLPRGVAGAFDTVAGVDEATGEARRFPMPVSGSPTAYEARADLPASPPEGTPAYVNNDPNPDNNGLWGFINGVWVKSADRVTGLEGRVSTNEDEIEDHAETLSRVGALRGVGGDVEILTDVAGSVVRRTDSRGHIHVPDLGGSVQDEITGLGERIYIGQGRRIGDFAQIEDRAGNIVVSVDSRGAVYIPGAAGSIQHALGVQTSGTPLEFTARENLHPSLLPLMSNLSAEMRPFIPPPALLVPNNYGLGDGFIDAFTAEQDDGVELVHPYGAGGMVHPHLIELRRPMYGCRYLLAETPHGGTAWQENPILFGSNDLSQFSLITDVQMPLGFEPGNQAGYNSDVSFTYDPATGELICFWRRVQSGIHFHYRKTLDGLNWSPERSVYVAPGTYMLSPSILYDPIEQTWRLWVINQTSAIAHFTGPTHEGPWTQVGTHNINTDFGINVWHAEVKWMGTKFVILANVIGAESNFYFGVSADGTTWDMGEGIISPQVPNCYKGTFIPEFDGDMVRFHIAWNTYINPIPPGVELKFHCVATNWVDVNTLGD